MLTHKAFLLILGILLLTVKTQIAIDPCAFTDCAPGFTCEKGKCIPCKVDACANILCPGGKMCVDGKCIEDPCIYMKCTSTTTCKNGFCVPN